MRARPLPTVAEAKAMLARQKALTTTEDRIMDANVTAMDALHNIAFGQMSANRMRMTAQDALAKLRRACPGPSAISSPCPTS